MAFGWLELPSLITKRLSLRSLTAEDAIDLFQIYGDPEVMRFASDPTFPEPSVVLQLLDSVNQLFQERRSLEWGIVLNQEACLVGTCGLHDFEQAQAEVGCLLARSYWGQGIMTEALQAVIDFGYRELKLKVITADIDAENHRSIALFERLGFVDQCNVPVSGSRLFHLALD